MTMNIAGIRGPYQVLITSIVESIFRLRLEVEDNPLAIGKLESALVYLYKVLPPSAKADINNFLSTTLYDVLNQANIECEKIKDSFERKVKNYIKCVSIRLEYIDSLFELIQNVMHEKGLYIVEKKDRVSFEDEEYAI